MISCDETFVIQEYYHNNEAKIRRKIQTAISILSLVNRPRVSILLNKAFTYISIRLSSALTPKLRKNILNGISLSNDFEIEK